MIGQMTALSAQAVAWIDVSFVVVPGSGLFSEIGFDNGNVANGVVFGWSAMNPILVLPSHAPVIFHH